MKTKVKNFLVFLIPILIFSGCAHRPYTVQNSEQYEIQINSDLHADSELTQIIQPYKEKLESEMNSVLAYSPIDLNKGRNQPLSNLCADLVLEESNQIYLKNHDTPIDISLLNTGGLRRTFTQGNLTVKSIFELMPFENEIVVVTLSPEKFKEMFEYLKQSNKGHPLSGMVLNQKKGIEAVLINGKPYNSNKNYVVVTSDYLQKGGDNMTFFDQALKVENLNIKLRDVMIDYFEKIDTVKVDTRKRYLP